MAAKTIGGKGEIAILSATAQATNQNAWIEVMKKELPEARVRRASSWSPSSTATTSSDKSYREAVGLFESYPNLKGIIAPTTVGIAAAGKAVTDAEARRQGLGHRPRPALRDGRPRRDGRLRQPSPSGTRSTSATPPSTIAYALATKKATGKAGAEVAGGPHGRRSRSTQTARPSWASPSCSTRPTSTSSPRSSEAPGHAAPSGRGRRTTGAAAHARRAGARRMATCTRRPTARARAREGISKCFPGVRRSTGVELPLPCRARCTALIGENGAGKSTARQDPDRHLPPDAGRDPARRAAGRLPQRPGRLARRHRRHPPGDGDVRRPLGRREHLHRPPAPQAGPASSTGAACGGGRPRSSRELGVGHRPPTRRCAALSVAQRHLVEIARALSDDARVVIMDEPTAALSAREIEDLFAIIRRLQGARARRSSSSPTSSTRSSRIADRYTVLRDGALRRRGRDRRGRPGRADPPDGRPRGRPSSSPRPRCAIGEPVLAVSGLSTRPSSRTSPSTLRQGRDPRLLRPGRRGPDRGDARRSSASSRASAGEVLLDGGRPCDLALAARGHRRGGSSTCPRTGSARAPSCPCRCTRTSPCPSLRRLARRPLPATGAGAGPDPRRHRARSR